MSKEVKKDEDLENALLVIGKSIWKWFGTKCPRTAYWIGAIVAALASAFFTFITYTAKVPYPEVENTETNIVEVVESPTNAVDQVESTNTVKEIEK